MSGSKKIQLYNKIHRYSLVFISVFSVISLGLFFFTTGSFVYNFKDWQQQQLLKEKIAKEILEEDQRKAELEFEELLVIPEKYAFLSRKQQQEIV